MSPSAETYADLVDLLPADDQTAARKRAIACALAFNSVSRGVRFLLQVGAAAEAESLLMERFQQLEGIDYTSLLPLAKLAAECDRPRIEMLCYRQLLNDILKEARSKAYGHAARYYKRLVALDEVIDDYGSAADHKAFVEAVRQGHGRKYAFWRRVEG